MSGEYEWKEEELPADDLYWFLWSSFPICGCGNPEAIVEHLYGMLRRAHEFHVDKDHTVKIVEEGNLFQLLLAYVIDDQHLTDHGSSIYGAWPTDLGKMVLALLDKHGTDLGAIEDARQHPNASCAWWSEHYDSAGCRRKE
jgi:hypothetical protein